MRNEKFEKEIKKYWILLPGEQKDMLLLFISSMTDQAETKHHTLQEPQVDYESGNLPSLLRQLGSEQKEALLLLIRSLVLADSGQTTSIEQYNKELDESEAEFERGEWVKHEEVVKMSKQWVNGN